MSKPVIDTVVLGVAGYRFRESVFGKVVVQIGERCLDWDTNTGMNDRGEYVRWRDITYSEVLNLGVYLIKEGVSK